MSTKSRSQEIKAGALILAAGLILLTFIFAISGAGFSAKWTQYKARFAYSHGIQPGSVVRFGGHLVGKIDEVYFPEDDGTVIEAVLSVREGTPVKEDSEAFITSIGLMGDFYIELTSGTPQSTILGEGGMLKSREIQSLTQIGIEMQEPLMRITGQAEELLTHFNTLIDDKNKGHLTSVLASVDTILAQNRGSTRMLSRNLADLSNKLKIVADRMDGLMQQNADSFHEALITFSTSMSRAESLMVEMTATSAQLNHMMARNEASFSEVLGNMEDASRHFETFSRRIKEQPWSLIRKSAAPERKFPNN